MASVFSWHRHFISCQQLEVYFSSWWMRPTVNRLEIDRKCKKQKIGELSRNGKQTVLNLTKIEAFSKCGKQQFHFFQKWNQIVKGSRQYFANHITLKNFREINSFVSSLVKTLIWRRKGKFFRKNRDRVLQHHFSTLLCNDSQNFRNFRENNLQRDLVNKWFHGIFAKIR